MFLNDKCPFFSLKETQVFCYTQKKRMICYNNGFNPQPSEPSSLGVFPINCHCTFKKKKPKQTSCQKYAFVARNIKDFCKQNIAKDHPWV